MRKKANLNKFPVFLIFVILFLSMNTVRSSALENDDNLTEQAETQEIIRESNELVENIESEIVEEFIEQHIDTIINISTEIEKDPSVILSEMGLKSDWGTAEYVQYNNYFEIINEVNKDFKVYESTEDSIRDYYLNKKIDTEEHNNLIQTTIELYNLKIFDENYTKKEEVILDSESDRMISAEMEDMLVPNQLKSVNYTANIISSNPVYKLENNKLVEISNSDDLIGNQVYVHQEINIDGVIYSNIISTRSNEIGWINKKTLDIERVLETNNVNYNAVIIKRNFSIDTLPWGIEGYETILKSDDLLNQKIKVIREQKTRRSTFVLFQINDNTLGWIDKNSLSFNYIFNEYNISYAVRLNDSETKVGSLPSFINGAVETKISKEFLNKNLLVTKEADTLLGIYSYLTLHGKPIGWVAKDILDIETPLEQKIVSYSAEIISQNHTIDTLPYGLEGFSNVAKSNEYRGSKIIATHEIVTRRGTFVKILRYGRELGWIDSNALKKDYIISEKNTQYAAKIVGQNNTIDTIPYGLEGFSTIGRTTDPLYSNNNIIVKNEITTSRGTFGLAYINNKEIGWIDKNALSVETVISDRKVHYAAKITTKNNTIDTLPYGLQGFKNISRTSSYYDMNIIANREIVTRRGTFVLINRHGKELGWVDKKALQVERIIRTNNVKTYRTKIINSGYSIDSQPYGIPGFSNISRTNSYLNDIVIVSEEKVTDRGTFSLVTLNGGLKGWVDNRALSGEKLKNVIILDPGHGGSESGAYQPGVLEKDLNLNISLQVRDGLEKLGYEVLMIRTDDRYVDLYDRARFANRSNADIFVSIHHNSWNRSTHGIESFYYKFDPNYPSRINGLMHNNAQRINESMKLTNSIHNYLINDTKAYNRGVKRETFAVLRETAIPATLLELGFMDNSNELRKLTNPSYQKILIEAIVKGIDVYFINN